MNNPVLVLPDVQYKESYLSALHEYIVEGRESEERFKEVENSFNVFVEKELSKAHGENLPEGFVSETRFWLIDGKEYIGDLRIRHRLNDHLMEIGGHIGYGIRPSKRKQGYGKLILKLGLEKAKEMGIKNVRITCDVTNEGSRKIIEANGGVLDGVVAHEGFPDIARFWIDISEPKS